MTLEVGLLQEHRVRVRLLIIPASAKVEQWCVLRGAWCVVHGAWCMVHGAWCVVRAILAALKRQET